VSRAVAVDMESATVAANGFRYRIPTATLLAVSDKPLHARPKLSADAQGFYTASRRQHVEIVVSVAETCGSYTSTAFRPPTCVPRTSHCSAPQASVPPTRRHWTDVRAQPALHYRGLSRSPY
jgi:hypothetical protein